MGTWLTLLIAVSLFVAGMRLGAFFSGTESGFYRISFLRLSIDAHSGDRVARWLMWFVQNPAFFVATTLVGNNISHYLITVAIQMGSHVFVHSTSALLEVVTTLLFAPIIFAFAELMPKSLYLRAPTQLLRRDAFKFRVCYRLFLPVTYPLVGLTRILERLTKSKAHEMEMVLGRQRLMQVLSKGHEHGLLTNEQGQLFHSLLHDAHKLAREVMTPAERILGLEEGATNADFLAFAISYGLPHVAVRRKGTPDGWFGYVRTIDLQTTSTSASSLLQPLPRLAFDATRLAALISLRESGNSVALVCDGDKIMGIVTQRALLERFMHPFGAKTTRHARTATAATRTPAAST